MLSSILKPDVGLVVDHGHVEEITGSIVAEVDTPAANRRVLASLDVIGTVGTAKLHVPRTKPVTFLMYCAVFSHCKYCFPLCLH